MSTVEKVETLVIGAGVIGLAVSRALSLAGHEVLLVDRASRIGSETSSRNSEVIHAGLYYPKHSLKARFCVRGRELLYEFCDRTSVRYQKIGKLVVATNADQVKILPELQSKALNNGVNDVKILSTQEVKSMEPNVNSYGALWSPSTGILDTHEFMLSLLAEAEENGTTLALKSTIEGARIDDEQTVNLLIDGTWLACRNVVNCAGLWADRIASYIHAKHYWRPPKQYYCKGNYYRLQGKTPFSHLIYPVPDPNGGLGIHATIDLAGQMKFGPDVNWLPIETDPDKLDNACDSSRFDSFYESIRQYWPDLPDNALVPDYSGTRPKLSHPDLEGPRPLFMDYVIAGPQQHGIAGLVHLFGIESPGLTSSMAIAEYVVGLSNK